MLRGRQFWSRSMVSSLFKSEKNNHYGDVIHQQMGQTYLPCVNEYNLIAGLVLGGWGTVDPETDEIIDQTNFMGGHSTCVTKDGKKSSLIKTVALFAV